MHRNLIVAVVAVSVLASGSAFAQPSSGAPELIIRGHRAGCFVGERDSDCRERLRAQQLSDHHYVWLNDRYEDRDAPGADIAGFIMGDPILGTSRDRDYYNAHRNDRSWRDRCSSAYSGFNYRTGTYVGDDGSMHYCVR